MRTSALVQRLLTLTLILGGGCDRTPEPKLSEPGKPALPPQPASAATPAPAASGGSAPAASSGSAPAATSYRLPSSARLVAIGDIHGDLKALRAALKLAGAIDSDDRWIGKDLTVVQAGDQLDRGDQDREVLDVLEKLERDAQAAGGALHVLNGNHELMNASLDFRYVTPRSFETFDDMASRAPEAAQRLPDRERGRAAAFAPGAPYAQKLARHLTVAVIGDSLFAHAGVLPAHVDYGLARINAEASAFLLGQRELSKALANEESPVWTRAYGSPEVDADTCRMLGRVLEQVGAKRLVVGHTVQKSGISSACQDRLFRIDIGLSAYYGDNPPQVLEITAAGARIVRAGNARPSATPASKKPDSALHSSP
jgi:hypothetical protein